MKKGDTNPFYNNLEEGEETLPEAYPTDSKNQEGSQAFYPPLNSASSGNSNYETPHQSEYRQKTNLDTSMDMVIDPLSTTAILEEESEQPPTFSNNTMKESPSMSTVSYSAYQRQQSNQPNKWLNEVNLDPYLKRQGETQNPFHKSSWKTDAQPGWEMQEKKNSLSGDELDKQRDPLLETLLPQVKTDIAARNEYISARKKKDSFFAYLFLASFSIMIIVGLAYVFRFPADLRDKLIFSSTAYRAFVESSPQLALIASISLLVAFIWSLLIKKYTRQVIWGLIVFIPISLSCLFLWAFISAFTGPYSSSSHDIWLIPISFSMLFASVTFVFFIKKSQSKIETTIKITSMAAEILFENPSIFVVSVGLLLLYVIFLVIWLTFFTHLTLIGYVSEDGGQSHWNISFGSYWAQAYFLMMLFWTTGVFTNIQRSVIGGVVAQWYFLRHQPSYKNTKPTLNSLKIAVKSSFGQIAFGALFLSSIMGIRMSFRLMKQGLKRTNLPIIRSVLSSVIFVMGFVEKLIEHVSQFAIYYVALKGDGFCRSGKAILRIFRRNLLLGFTTDYIAQLILLFSTLITALITGLASYLFVSHVLGSAYSLYVGSLYSAIAWYLMQFFSNIVSDTMDATFMCYAIDLDSEKIRCQLAHEAFSKKSYTN